MQIAIIIHGMPDRDEYFNVEGDSQSNSHWIPWLQQQLIVNGVSTQTPDMPEAYEPDYQKWLSIFSNFKIDENTILVGHSCGSGFLIRYLSENDVKVGSVFLVAPWLDTDQTLNTNFFEFEIDRDFVSKTKSVNLIYSTDDYADVLDSVNKIVGEVGGVNVIKFENKKHFTFEDMKTRAFPELLDLILSKK
jgi:predicted alpha/beta hydrolase family esterase